MTGAKAEDILKKKKMGNEATTNGETLRAKIIS